MPTLDLCLQQFNTEPMRDTEFQIAPPGVDITLLFSERTCQQRAVHINESVTQEGGNRLKGGLCWRLFRVSFSRLVFRG
jgi:hypothetical protein